jgi:hypothetical protein
MSRSTKQAWLEGPGDLREADVEDVPVKGQTVRVRGLPAAYSNQASSEALELKTTNQGEQLATVNTAILEELQFAHGCVDPTFSVEEARAISQKYGPAYKKVIAKIDELSGIDKEAIESAQAAFPVAERSGNGQTEALPVQSPARSG